MEPWIQAFSGREFHYNDQSKMDVSLLDIAHSLANTCRFGGHVKQFYSVAQHSVIVSRIVRNEWHGRYTFFSIMHDAAEAYIGDIVKPLKHSLGKTVNELEELVMDRICAYFEVSPLGSMGDLDREILHAIKCADESALATEARDLMNVNDISRWKLRSSPISNTITPIDPDAARSLFLKRFFNSNQCMAKRVFEKEPEVSDYMRLSHREWIEFQAMIK